MPVSDDEFETMRARARVYRKRLDELGSVSGPVVRENVRNRLRLLPAEPLPPAQTALEDEIVDFLKDSRLDTLRARMLEREFLGH